jgi:hypothetical protein
MIQINVLLYLGILVSGLWLSRLGKPYNAILLTIHKLVSLAAVVVLVFTVVRVRSEAALGVADWVAVSVSGLFFAGTIATGALLSVDKPMPPAILVLHRIMPFLTVLSTAATLYLLLAT